MLLDIVKYGDPVLRQKGERVGEIMPEITQLIDDMVETMHEAHGIGLAAPQVGDKRRVIVVDVVDEDAGPDPVQMANPELLWVSDEMLNQEEGCLSLPEHYAEVERHNAIRVRYLDYQGEIREREVAGVLATCIQHEMDHLDGILFVDLISSLKRNMILRKLSKAKKMAAAPA